MAKKWVKEARNNVKNEVQLRLETEKALRAAKEENKELLSKLTAKERERRNVEARLKNAQTQTEDQRNLLYQIEIEMSISRQLMLELKVNLQKAKEAAQLAKETTEAEKQASHRGVIQGMQGLLHGNMGKSPQPCRSPCSLRVEATEECILPPRDP